MRRPNRHNRERERIIIPQASAADKVGRDEDATVAVAVAEISQANKFRAPAAANKCADQINVAVADRHLVGRKLRAASR